MGGLQNVMDALTGYEDPPEYRDPVDGKNLGTITFVLDAAQKNPLEQNAQDFESGAIVLHGAFLPNGRSVPVHDTWPNSRRARPKSNASRLWRH